MTKPTKTIVNVQAETQEEDRRAFRKLLSEMAQFGIARK